MELATGRRRPGRPAAQKRLPRPDPPWRPPAVLPPSIAFARSGGVDAIKVGCVSRRAICNILKYIIY